MHLTYCLVFTDDELARALKSDVDLAIDGNLLFGIRLWTRTAWQTVFYNRELFVPDSWAELAAVSVFRIPLLTMPEFLRRLRAAGVATEFVLPTPQNL